MSSRLTVVYDACVLYPAPLRDLLMHLALSDLTPAQLNRTRQLMNAHVRDSLVSGFERLISSIDLPAPLFC